MKAIAYFKYLTLILMPVLALGVFLFSAVSVSEAGMIQPYAIVDDFDNADPDTNFLGLVTGSGDFVGGDMVASYDVFGPNANDPLNTAHQLSWDGSLGPTTGPEGAFWYSFVSNGTNPVIPASEFTHLRLKIQAGMPVAGKPNKRDMLGIDLQVNCDPAADPEGKPFRIYRAYQPVVNTEELDTVSIGLYDFCDEYNPAVRFTDNLTSNIANLRAVAVAMTDHTDSYLTDTDGDGVNLGLDNYGTIFIEDVSFWNRTKTTRATLMIDDFEDADTTKNKLGYDTGVWAATGAAEEEFAGSKRFRIDWAASSQNTRFITDVSNNGTQLMDLTGYTHLAFDTICPAVDDADCYEAILIIVNSVGEMEEYSFSKALGSKRIQEEYIPLNRFRHGSSHYPAGNRDLITAEYLGRVKAIKLFFSGGARQDLTALGNDSEGTIWIDNIRVVTIASGPLYNYPPLISAIDGQDVSNDFGFWPQPHRNFYGKNVAISQPVTFNITAGDNNVNLSELTMTLPTNPPIPTGGTIVFNSTASGASATGTFSWTPTLADVGTHRILFKAIDNKGARDIQQFDLIVYDPIPPVASFTATPMSGTLPLTVQFTDTSTGSIAGWSWTFWDATNQRFLPGSTEQNPVLTIIQHGLIFARLTVTGPGGSSVTPDTRISAEVGTIHGTLTNASTGVVLPNANIQVWRFSYPDIDYNLYAQTTTSQDGYYEFNNLPSVFHHNALQADHYKIKVTGRAGYMDYESSEIVFYQSGTWLPDIVQHNIALVKKENYIKGNVHNALTGAPVAGAAITIKPMAYGYGTHDYTTTTDENGDYKVNDLISYVQSSGGATTWISYTVHISASGYNDFVSEPVLYSETECQFIRDAGLATVCIGTGYIAANVAFTSYPDLKISGIEVRLWKKDTGDTEYILYTTMVSNGTGVCMFSNLPLTFPAGSTSSTSYKVKTVPQFGYAAYESGDITFYHSTWPAPGYSGLMICDVRLTRVTQNKGVMSGCVTANGQAFSPLANVNVELWKKSYGDADFVLLQSTATNITGDYSFAELPEIFYHNAPQAILYKVKVAAQGAYEAYEGDAVTFYNGWTNWVDAIQCNVPLVPVPAPVAAMTVTPKLGLAPLAVSFTDNSTGNVTSRSWDFGDGQTNTQQNPSHTYTTAGTYTATLTVTGPGGTASTSVEIRSAMNGQLLQTAINNAAKNSTLVVPKGTYILTSQLTIPKNLTIKCADPDYTMIVLKNYKILIKDSLYMSQNEAYYQLYNNLTDVTLENLIITGYTGTNSLGPIEAYVRNFLTLKDCKLIGNKGTSVSGIYYGGTYLWTDATKTALWKTGGLKLINTLVAGNIQEEGHGSGGTYSGMQIDSQGRRVVHYTRGVIYANGGKLEISNSTIADNINNSNVTHPAYVDYGAIYLNTSNLNTMTNTIMWNNGLDKDDIWVLRGGLVTNITYSDIDSWTLDGAPSINPVNGWGYARIPGEGSISEDPLFNEGTYTISDTSPCKGRGLNGVDMGAKF